MASQAAGLVPQAATRDSRRCSSARRSASEALRTAVSPKGRSSARAGEWPISRASRNGAKSVAGRRDGLDAAIVSDRIGGIGWGLGVRDGLGYDGRGGWVGVEGWWVGRDGFGFGGWRGMGSVGAEEHEEVEGLVANALVEVDEGEADDDDGRDDGLRDEADEEHDALGDDVLLRGAAGDEDEQGCVEDAGHHVEGAKATRRTRKMRPLVPAARSLLRRMEERTPGAFNGRRRGRRGSCGCRR